ncbi:MAG: hypothetical protein DMG07_00400 [Acidobacteria bacterium]|nr:MAG: hypothetical protein DMG07_00400 [Acidobacteriota bacterium]
MNARTRIIVGLTLSFLPGSLFILGLLLLRSRGQAPWPLPWELWGIAIGGSAALLAALADWHYHTHAAAGRVGPREEETELVALGFGGLPLFLTMAWASRSSNPRIFLIPVVAILVFTVVMICRDEFIFHRRRCGAWENFLHKVIVFGNGLAWLTWFHWVFVRARVL